MVDGDGPGIALSRHGESRELSSRMLVLVLAAVQDVFELL